MLMLIILCEDVEDEAEENAEDAGEEKGSEEDPEAAETEVRKSLSLTNKNSRIPFYFYFMESTW